MSSKEDRDSNRSTNQQTSSKSIESPKARKPVYINAVDSDCECTRVQFKNIIFNLIQGGYCDRQHVVEDKWLDSYNKSKIGEK